MKQIIFMVLLSVCLTPASYSRQKVSLYNVQRTSLFNTYRTSLYEAQIALSVTERQMLQEGNINLLVGQEVNRNGILHTSERKITFHVEQEPITEVLRLIESQSGVLFSYNPGLLKGLPTVSLQVTGLTLDVVLEKIFGNTGIQYIRRDNYIILKKRAEKITVSGFIYDRSSHEPLIGANLFDMASKQGAVSNNFGFFSFSIPPGHCRLRASYVGYLPENQHFTALQDTVMHFYLEPSSLLQELVVEGALKNPVLHTETGRISLDAATLKAIPAFMGESDVIKALQLMPGVAVGTDGMAGLYVRGGNIDENLYLIDGNPLYHVNHLLGIFSTFNPEAVKTMDFYKGSFPARYGGRLSSVVDVRMNDGDMKKFSGSATIGLISSRLNLQGPLVKDRTSFSVSFRRTYLDLISRPAMYFYNRKMEKEDPYFTDKLNMGYYFYDFNAKISHKLSDKSRLYLNLYEGKDKFFVDNDQRYGGGSYGTHPWDGKDYVSYDADNGVEKQKLDIGWGNRMASLSWAYALNNKLFSNATLVYSRYQSSVSFLNEDKAWDPPTDNDIDIEIRPEQEGMTTPRYALFNPIYKSGIEDIGYRYDLDYAYDNRHFFRFGTSLLHHNFRPEMNRIYRSREDADEHLKDTTIYAKSRITVKELSLYAEDEMTLGDRLKANIGMHFSAFIVQGKTYLSAQPRLSLRFLLDPNWSLKASYAQMNQYVHLLQSSYLNSPDDLWVPITKNVKPLSSHQLSTGIYGRHHGFDLSAEVYYKHSNNLVEYKEGTSILSGNGNWEERVAQGIGHSYGLELMAKKSIRNTSGWIGYTLSWANRQFPNGEINRGKVYPAKFDNRHKINAVLMHTFNQKFDLSLSWIYSTGNWTTLPEEEYIDMNGTIRQYIDERNNYKMPHYQRLDLSFNYYRQKKKGRTAIWNFSFYNLYAHHNSFLVLATEKIIDTPDYDPYTGNFNHKSRPVYKSFCLFPIIPSFSYTYKF